MVSRAKVKAPAEFDSVRDAARSAIAPLKPADNKTAARHDFLFTAKRAVSWDRLPQPYLIYFLLVELLGFKNLGRFDKVAWSVPLDYEGKAFLVKHRKFGVGIFTQDDEDLEAAKKIAIRLQKGTKTAERYFRWKASQAVAASQFNVTNNSRDLLHRYEHLKGLYLAALAEAGSRKEERIRTEHKNGWSVKFPYFGLMQEARWLAIATVDAFFSWTEHVFVLIAILSGKVPSGEDFAVLASADWRVKFKRALDISDSTTKKLFDELYAIRREVRNRLAHGTFGKDGEMLHFHSSAGAVPVTMDITAGKSSFSLSEGLQFDLQQTFDTIDRFLVHLWDGPRKPAWIYIQDFALPLILTMALNGKYQSAMVSSEAMEAFALHLAEQMDNAANMDW